MRLMRKPYYAATILIPMVIACDRSPVMSTTERAGTASERNDSGAVPGPQQQPGQGVQLPSSTPSPLGRKNGASNGRIGGSSSLAGRTNADAYNLPYSPGTTNPPGSSNTTPGTPGNTFATGGRPIRPPS